jgi:N6-adenosine-specific RNA methylase IME4|tara:strand:- start:157 stop:339 length:183 start_codon:yes stop_codon:yes gene_type:complete
MNDKQIENIQTVDVKVTAESIDAHVLCLRENGYKVEKTFTSWTKYTMAFLLGAYIIQMLM